MIIDCHGHFTTAPAQLAEWRDRQIAAVGSPADAPDPDGLVITDDDLRRAVEGHHTTGAHYMNADTTAFMQLVQGDPFADFPTLRFVIPHGGGAVPYHWGRFRGLAMALGRPDPETLLDHVFFDCVYHQPGIDLLTRVIPSRSVLFASEMIGAVRDIDPRTGHHFDDTKRYVDATSHLSDGERAAVYAGNALRVYPRLAARLAAAGR
ncbi:amidohydrolase family protein [Streptomyces sp. NPDC099050]|uniref:amidohydrolase family protein n=1 Tax=Streptomyces sp. NPDC099050 TaxID=3366100 RepID=UPI00380A1FF5